MEEQEANVEKEAEIKVVRAKLLRLNGKVKSQ